MSLSVKKAETLRLQDIAEPLVFSDSGIDSICSFHVCHRMAHL
jgi:hypothetical protein